MTPTFTASEISQAIGWSKPRVANALRFVSKNCVKIVCGNEAPAWNVGALPESLSSEIERLRAIHHFRTADELLQNPTRPWSPAIGITQASQADVRRATQLKEALARALQAGELVSFSESARIAAPDYRRVFGRDISKRQLCTLIARTIDRDRGARNFDRLEIYLPEKTRSKKSQLVTAQFQGLADDFATVRDRANPTVTERAFCWRKIVACCPGRAVDGQNSKAVKRALIDFVFAQMPSLGASVGAIKRNLDRKFNAAAAGETLIDRRSEKSGARRKMEVWSEDLQKLARHARHETGRVSQSYRELYQGKTATGERFSEKFREHYPSFDVRRSKSDVPPAVRAAIRPILKATAALHRGPKAARISGPSYQRDWSDVCAGDSYSADDFTFNHYFIEWDEAGDYVFQGKRFNLTRGQTLLFCDERSQFILGFFLTPRPNYGADTICDGINRICMDELIGLPFRRFHFERGSWKSRAVKSAVDWSRIDEAFSREGIDLGLPSITHTTTPKAKIIERIGGRIQDLMQGAPGYAGRNERLDGPERTQKAIASLRRFDQRSKQDRDPQIDFLNKEQFCTELEDAARRFNAEPQNGKLLPGISPEEAWKTFQRETGHKLLPDSLRYLLSTQVTEVTVTPEGVTLRRRGEPPRTYCGHERLGELVGEKVRVRFSAETPEVITVCDLQSDPRELAPFSVELDPTIPAIDATREDFQRARGARHQFTRYGRDQYRIIAPRFNRTILDANTGSADARRTGEALIAAKQERVALTGARSSAGRRAAKIAKRHGIHVNVSRLNRPELRLKDAELMEQTEARILQREAASDDKDRP